MFKVSYLDTKDIPIVKEFYQKAYPEHFEKLSGSYFDWLYLDNIIESKIKIVVIKDDENNNIIAHEGLYNDYIKFSGISYKVTWGTDLFVLPEYRGKGLANNLHQFIHQNEDVYIAISMAESTRVLLEKFNHVYLKPINSLAIVFNDTFFLEKKNVASLLKHNYYILGKVFFLLIFKLKLKLNINFLTRRILFKGEKNIVKNIYLCDFNDEPFLNFINTDVNTKQDTHVLTQEIINWKYIKQPGKEFKLFVYKNNDKILGYIIVYSQEIQNYSIGVISDIYSTSTKVYSDLIDFAIDYFRKSKRVSLHILESDRNNINELKRKDFIIINKRKPILISSKLTLKVLNLLKKSPIRFNYESHDIARYFNFRY